MGQTVIWRIVKRFLPSASLPLPIDARKCGRVMGSAEANILEEGEGRQRSFARWLKLLAFAVLGLIALIAVIAWFTRERIAGNLIDGYLEESGLEASYDIVRIGPKRQVIENLMIGKADSPDLIVKRIVIDVAYRLGTPRIGSATLVNPRLYGSIRDGQLSLGALDPLIFADDGDASGLPAIDVTVIDGGALLETDYGAVGAFVNGEGRLDDGFAGKLAVTAPNLAIEGCTARTLTAYGDIAISEGAPRFAGPVRVRGAECGGVVLRRADIAADLSSDAGFGRLEGRLGLSAGGLKYLDNAVANASGQADIVFQESGLTLDHDVVLESISTRYGRLASLTIGGALRRETASARSDWRARFTGEGVDFTQVLGGALNQARGGSEGTLLEPLLAKLERNLGSATRGGGLAAQVTWRASDEEQSFVIPEARLRSANGESVAALSRVSWLSAGGASGGTGAGRLTGNFLIGGTGLPQINGRMERGVAGVLALRMAMAEYSAGDNAIALPSFSLRQEPSGSFLFSGALTASGALPGGSVKDLSVPLTGRIDQAGGVVMGTRCETVRFRSLALYDLALGAQSIRLCPSERRAMLRYDNALSIGVQTDDLALTGELAETPSKIAASRASLNYPGGFALDNLTARIGKPGNSIFMSAASLTGTLDGSIAGEFSDAQARMDAVPLDLNDLAGQWSYADDILRVERAGFTLTERTDNQPRFEPLRGEDATLTLFDSVITTNAILRHPASGTAITSVDLRHDLTVSTGHADIGVDALTFGPGLSLDDLTYLSKGVIAYTEGSVSGEGRIDWNADDITSTGTFRTDGLDFAAAFGPIDRLRGQIRFSDLVNLTTEPGQVIEIGAVNPGIEVLGGRVQFSMTNGEVIQIEDGRWPFMGGELIVRPVTLRYDTAEEHRYTFEMIGLDAAKFVAQMELSNLGASGLFDGTVPIIFDAEGNGRIEGGLLISRAPGGNVSYIGELTYEDMGAITNYAFQSLRSLDYTQMSVDLEGDLAGEIITRFKIDGVQQGEGADRNFITRRLARLPIRFIVNVRSENFYELATMVRTFWDPEALGGPEDKGLDLNGALPAGIMRLPAPSNPRPTIQVPSFEARRSDETAEEAPDEPAVQPPESEPMP